MKTVIYIVLLWLPLIGYGQHFADKTYYLVDSVDLSKLSEQDKSLLEKSLKSYKEASNDTSRIAALSSIIEYMENPVWQKYQWFQLDIIEKLLQNESEHPESIKKYLHGAYNAALSNIAFIYIIEGNVNEGLEYFSMSLKDLEKSNDKKSMGRVLNNMGIQYNSLGNISKALDCYERSLLIGEEMKDTLRVARTLSNIAAIYGSQGDLDKSLQYYSKSLFNLRNLRNKKDESLLLGSIAALYVNNGQLEKALEYADQALKIQEANKYRYEISTTCVIIGDIYRKQNKFIEAERLYLRSLEIENSLGNKEGISEVLRKLGFVKLALKQNDLAKKYGEESLALAKEVKYPGHIKNSASLLYSVYVSLGNYKKALEMHELFVLMKDSINNSETQKAALRQQAKYEYQQQKTLDDLNHEKELLLEQKAKEKQRIIAFTTAIGFILVVIFLFFIFNRLRVTRRQKAEIEKAHLLLEEKNTEILDSITYAKRIQSAILPSDKSVREHLPESFILYKPKDIVAGDFYWLEFSKNRILFAAADCTGHGVPGAMVSVVCNNALNRSVREYGLTDTSEILNKTREIVIQEFEKSADEVKDGMDIALCCLDGNKLQFSGANNPLWLIRNNELMECKGDKQPIGKFDKLLPFSVHSFELQKGDMFYIFTDGYADQFGGEHGKKFKSKAFKELLLSVNKKPIDDQKQLIEAAFENWRSGREQVDDVCVIGVRF